MDAGSRKSTHFTRRSSYYYLIPQSNRNPNYNTTQGVQISIEILDSDHNKILTAKGDDIKVQIPKAKLWNAEHPFLYTCRVNVENEGKIIETHDIKFGIRHISWSTKGFFVNGEKNTS